MGSTFPIALAGPTGSGKSRLALELASAIDGEIVNYDSIQMYRGFDIGSAKPASAERSTIPHHLFDVVEAGDEFHAAEFQRRADEVCAGITSRGRWPILVGGTSFYLRAFLVGLPPLPPADETLRARLRRIATRPRGREHLHRLLARVDPLSGQRIAAGDRQRVERALEVFFLTGRPISSWKAPGPDSLPRKHCELFALLPERGELHRRLDERTEAMYRAGLIDETAGLLSRYPETARPFGSIGYREAVAVLRGRLTVEDAIAETKRRTRAYARRQLTWLRAERGVHWLEPEAPLQQLIRQIREIVESRPRDDEEPS